MSVATEVMNALTEKIRAIEAGEDLNRMAESAERVHAGPSSGVRESAGGESETAARTSADACVLATGWSVVDTWLGGTESARGAGGGLKRGAVHEFCGVGAAAMDAMKAADGRGEPVSRPSGHRRRRRGGGRGGAGVPGENDTPRSVLAHLAGRALAEDRSGRRVVLWVGRRVWPDAATLVGVMHAATGEDRAAWMEERGLALTAGGRAAVPRGVPRLRRVSVESGGDGGDGDDGGAGGVLRRHLFIDPADVAGRLWAIDLALRSPAVAAVAADGFAMDLMASRRLALSARAGRTICLLARPPDVLGAPSAAATRWAVGPAGADGTARGMRWRVKLLRCKGMQPISQTWRDHDGASDALLEWHRGSGLMCVPADVGGSALPAPTSPILTPGEVARVVAQLRKSA